MGWFDEMEELVERGRVVLRVGIAKIGVILVPYFVMVCGVVITVIVG